MMNYPRRKNSVKIIVALTTVAALIFLVSNYVVNKANEVVIAEVNGSKILKSEIETKLHSVFDGQNQEIQIPEVENLPQEVLEILVKEIYLDKELSKKAEKSKLAKDPIIKAQIADAQNKILRQAYVNSLIKEEITDQKVSEKYAELSSEITGKKEYLMSHIVTKSKSDAEKILHDLKARKISFTEAAKKYSIDQDSAAKGGELGYVPENGMIKEIAGIVANLQKDEISAPIQTKFGWHLIKISDIRDAKAPAFETVKDNIRDQLAQDKLNEINSKITKDAKIHILIELKKPEEKPLEQTGGETAPVQVELEKNNGTNPVQNVVEENSAKAEETKVEAAVEKQPEPEAVQEPVVKKQSDAKSKKQKSKHKKQTR